MGQSSNYYPQGNGLAESTKKMLIQIIKKKIATNHKNWHKKLTDLHFGQAVSLQKIALDIHHTPWYMEKKQEFHYI
jgi:hypothetical protein